MSDRIRFENYELLRRPDGSAWELGRGAMGVTYKARDTDLHCDVALKIINPSILSTPEVEERFLREARAAAKLRHPNIATVFRLGVTEDGTHYYAMEFCDGQTLQQMIEASGPLPAANAVHLGWQVSRALRIAEEHHLIHRDLKPANLIVVETPDDGLVVKVIDFGLAKSIAGGHQTFISAAQGFAGTAHFASPEQIDEQDLDIRSDFYSLGASLWFMLAGHPPFEGSAARVMSQTLSGDLPWTKLTGQPEPVLALLRRMLARNREDRPSTAAALRGEMERCMEGLEAEAHKAEPPTIAAFRPINQGASRSLVPEAPREDVSATTLTGADTGTRGAPVNAASPTPGMSPAAPPELPRVTAPEQSTPTALSPLHPGTSKRFLVISAGVLLLVAGAIFYNFSHPKRQRESEESASYSRTPASSPRPFLSAPSKQELAETKGAARTEPEKPEGGDTSNTRGTEKAKIPKLEASPEASNVKPRAADATPANPAVAPPADPPKTGRILINTVPPRATVLLDGKDNGASPMLLEEATNGIHRIHIQLDGYEPVDLMVEVRGGATSDPGTVNLVARKPDVRATPVFPQLFNLPAPPPRPANDLEDEAVRALVRNELAATVRGDLATLVACYASSVDYYDEGRKSSAALRHDLEIYRQMWPLLEISNLSLINVSATHEPDVKTASYSYVFVARNPQNGKQSRGVAHEEISVRLIGGRYLIFRCRQTITDRAKNFRGK